MVCKHLRDIETALIDAGVMVTQRGQVWSDNCREWVYFACRLDCDALLARHEVGPSVRVHRNDDARSGLELGIECTECHDALMGQHPDVPGEWPAFPTTEGS